MKKRFLSTFLALLMLFTTALVLTACGGGNSEAAPEAASGEAASTGGEEAESTGGEAGAGGEVVLWMPGNIDDPTEALNRTLALFEQIREETGIDLQVEVLPFASYDEKCNTALNTNTGPDVLMVNSVTLGTFTHNGYLQDISGWLADSTIKEEDFFPGLWGHVALSDGKVYGLPVDTGTRAIIYNKDLLAASSIEFGGEITWQELQDAAIACTKDEDGDGTPEVYGYGFVGGENWVNLYEGFGMFMVQNGANAYNEAMDKAQFSSPEMIEALQVLVDMHAAGVMPMDSITITDGAVMNDMFVSGNVAMFTGGHWALDYVLEKNPEFEVGVALAKNTQIGSSTGGWCMSMTNKATNMDGIRTVYEYIYQPENLVNFTSLMPATIAASELTLTDPIYDPYKEVLAYARHPIPINKDLPEVAGLLRDQMQRVFLGEATLEEATAQLDQDVDALLARQ